MLLIEIAAAIATYYFHFDAAIARYFLMSS